MGRTLKIHKEAEVIDTCFDCDDCAILAALAPKLDLYVEVCRNKEAQEPGHPHGRVVTTFAEKDRFKFSSVPIPDWCPRPDAEE